MGANVTELVLVALAAMMSPTTLSFSVIVLVVGSRPLRTGLWFYLGAMAATLAVGVLAAFAVGSVAASSSPSTPKTPVAAIDIAAGVLILAYVTRNRGRPIDEDRVEAMTSKASKLADSPATAILGAGATLANPGGFIPLAIKDISETAPSTAGFLLEWVAFALVSLLPLSAALLALVLVPDPTQRLLLRVRGWLLRHARTVAMAILVLLAAAMLRNGIAGLTA